MTAERVGERVTVGAVFATGRKVRPVWFIWRGRKVMVSTTCSWSEHRGRDLLRHFSVTDGSDLFELVMDGGSLDWTLEKVEAG